MTDRKSCGEEEFKRVREGGAGKGKTAFVDNRLRRLLAFLFVSDLFFASARATVLLGDIVIRRRFLAFLFILFLSGLSAACVKHITVAEPLPVNPPLAMDELVNRVNQLADFQTFGARGTIQVTNYFTGKTNKADELPGANYIIRLKRAEKLRLRVSAPFIGKQVADMATDGDRFQLAIFWPDDKRQFVYGNNLDEIKRVGEEVELKDPTLQKAGGLLNMRPQHITGAYLFTPISPQMNVFREEVRQEERETQGPKKGKRVERSYYVLYVIERNGEMNGGENGGQGGALMLRRKFWFDRTRPGTPLVRQQTFENGGRNASDIYYLDWVAVRGTNRSVPKRIKLERRNDGYGVELITEDNIEINEDYEDEVFLLKNTETLPERNLDEPRRQAPPAASKKQQSQ